jgi:hypothetical protein
MENRMLSEKSEKEDLDGYDTWKECQTKELWKRCVSVARKIEVCWKEKKRKRWLNDVENYLKKMGVRGWRKTAEDRNDWELIQKGARVLRGP